LLTLPRIPIKTAFPDYTGKATYEDSLNFVKARFTEQKKQGPVGFHSLLVWTKSFSLSS
jgi:hypothetical protein